MPNFQKIGAVALIFMMSSFSVQALDQNSTYNKEQIQQDYRTFLQQLKTLNSQYKEITGEISRVIKEEGLPTWDMGDAANLMSAPADTIFTVKESDQDMTVMLDLPGLKKDTLKIAVQDSKKLTVLANRKIDADSMKIEKIIDLPSAVDPKTAKATYEDGVLTIKLAKVSSKEVLIPVR